jgi:hypothetical protein
MDIYKTELRYTPKNLLPPDTFNKECNLDNLFIDKREEISKNIWATPDTDSHVYYVNISSNNRDSTNYPLHYNYRINLDSQFKNVKSVELVSAIFPNQPAASSGGNILNEPFLIVDVEELNYIDFPDNVGSPALKGFGVIPLKVPTQTSGGFIIGELGCIYHTKKEFYGTLGSLSRFTIKIRDCNGNLYDFGSTGGSTSKSFQNFFVFKITTQEISQKYINPKFSNPF